MATNCTALANQTRHMDFNVLVGCSTGLRLVLCERHSTIPTPANDNNPPTPPKLPALAMRRAA